MIEGLDTGRCAEPDRLFRRSAVEGQRPKAFGEIVIVRPISFGLLSAAAGLMGTAIVAFFLWGTYTEHSTLIGRLVPEGGVTIAYAPQPGVIVEKRIDEGEAVRGGDVLYVVASERLSSAVGATQTLVGLELERRRKSLEEQMQTTRILQEADRGALLATIAALEQEAGGTQAMIANQSQRAELAAETARRYARLRGEGYVAEEHYIARHEAWLEQRSRLQALERELRATARELVDARNRLQALPMQYRNRIAELERGLAAARQESLENEARRSILVVAPREGIATAVRGEVGQHVDSITPLLSIVPSDARLYAQLFAPSRAVGFIDVGDIVRLRYEAYPYQKFGHHEGTVSSVSRTALSVDELRGFGAISESGPMFLITVDLHSPAIAAYGTPRHLQAGMALEADVLHETRRLYEWVLEPLHTLTGRVH